MSHPQQCSEERGHFRRPDGKECYCGTLLFDGCFITLRRKLDADSLDLTIDVTDQDVTRYIISNRTPKQTTLNLHLGRFLDLSPPITGEYESLTIRTPLPEELAKLPHSKPMRTKDVSFEVREILKDTQIPLTWKQVKEKIERQGVRDNDPIAYIDITGMHEFVVTRVEYDFGMGLSNSVAVSSTAPSDPL